LLGEKGPYRSRAAKAPWALAAPAAVAYRESPDCKLPISPAYFFWPGFSLDHRRNINPPSIHQLLIFHETEQTYCEVTVKLPRSIFFNKTHANGKAPAPHLRNL
jgi:hypothetical protein